MNDKKEIHVGYFPIMEIKKESKEQVNNEIEKQAEDYADSIDRRGCGWISVEKRLPENNETVLCYTKEGRRFIQNSYSIGSDQDINWFKNRFTHWMPLSAPPNETQSTEQSNESEESNLIIRGLEEGSQLWKSEYENCRKILKDLVILKTWKDENINKEQYEAFKPLAWETAIKFLEKYQHS